MSKRAADWAGVRVVDGGSVFDIFWCVLLCLLCCERFMHEKEVRMF